MSASRIIVAYPCMGKSTLTKELKAIGYNVIDFDSMVIKNKKNGWEFIYVDKILDLVLRNYDYIFVSYNPTIIKYLSLTGLDFTTVIPDVSDQATKEMVVGRVFLRDYPKFSHIDWARRLISLMDTVCDYEEVSSIVKGREIILIDKNHPYLERGDIL